MSVLLKSDVPDVAPRARQEYEYEEPDGAPVAEHASVMSDEPSYTAPGSAHASASAPLFNTVTVTNAVADSAFRADAVSVYSYVSSLVTEDGT